MPGATVSVEVEYRGQRLPPIRATASDIQAAFFTLDASGAGQAVAVNEDGSLNSPANPAPLGSVITLFATGLGATVPESIEGEVAASTAAKPKADIQVALAGPTPTELLYIGPSPGSLTSITQINVRLPVGLPLSLNWPRLGIPVLFQINGRYLFSRVATIALR